MSSSPSAVELEAVLESVFSIASAIVLIVVNALVVPCVSVIVRKTSSWTALGVTQTCCVMSPAQDVLYKLRAQHGTKRFVLHAAFVSSKPTYDDAYL